MNVHCTNIHYYIVIYDFKKNRQKSLQGSCFLPKYSFLKENCCSLLLLHRGIDQNIFLQKFRESLCGCLRARLGFSWIQMMLSVIWGPFLFLDQKWRFFSYHYNSFLVFTKKWKCSNGKKSSFFVEK